MGLLDPVKGLRVTGISAPYLSMLGRGQRAVVVWTVSR
jgi:hypothetical protein